MGLWCFQAASLNINKEQDIAMALYSHGPAPIRLSTPPHSS
jgi:hypothetical protein